MKKFATLLMGLSFLCVSQAHAQLDNIFKHFGVSAGIGTTGITIDASTMVTDWVGVRGGIDIFPGFSYSDDINMAGLDEFKKLSSTASSGYYNFPVPDVPSKLDIEGKLKLTTGHVLFDVYPFPVSSFHVTVGAYFGAADIISVYNKEDGVFKDVRDFNDRSGKYAAWKPYDVQQGSTTRIGVEMGDYFLQPDQSGNLEASIRVNGFQPYLGIGFGRAVPKGRLACQFDLGVKFWGTPEVYLQDYKLDKSDVKDGDASKVFDVMNKITVYPVLSFRLVGRIL